MKRLLYAIPILAAPILLALYKADKPAKTEKTENTGRTKMTVNAPAPPASVKSDQPRPPIDDAAPAATETATFALG